MCHATNLRLLKVKILYYSIMCDCLNFSFVSLLFLPYLSCFSLLFNPVSNNIFSTISEYHSTFFFVKSQIYYSIPSITTPCAIPGTFWPSLKLVLLSNAPVGKKRILFHSPLSIFFKRYADSTVAAHPQPLPPA